jgi:branched-subunit amino acid transport protein AzlD
LDLETFNLTKTPPIPYIITQYEKVRNIFAMILTQKIKKALFYKAFRRRSVYSTVKNPQLFLRFEWLYISSSTIWRILSAVLQPSLLANSCIYCTRSKNVVLSSTGLKMLSQFVMIKSTICGIMSMRIVPSLIIDEHFNHNTGNYSLSLSTLQKLYAKLSSTHG